MIAYVLYYDFTLHSKKLNFFFILLYFYFEQSFTYKSYDFKVIKISVKN